MYQALQAYDQAGVGRARLVEGAMLVVEHYTRVSGWPYSLDHGVMTIYVRNDLRARF